MSTVDEVRDRFDGRLARIRRRQVARREWDRFSRLRWARALKIVDVLLEFVGLASEDWSLAAEAFRRVYRPRAPVASDVEDDLARRRAARRSARDDLFGGGS